MEKGVLLPPAAVSDLREMKKIVLGSSATKSRRRRRRRVAGRGGSLNLRQARVTAAIPAATGNFAGNWGVGGAAKLLNESTLHEEGESIDVTNTLQKLSFDEDFWVRLDMSHSPPRVFDGSCGPWVWNEEAP